MKITATHIALFATVMLPACANVMTAHFRPGSIGALLAIFIGAVGLGVKESVLPSVNRAAAARQAQKGSPS